MPPRYFARPVARSVYSHPLSEETRRATAHALAQISALRAAERHPVSLRARLANLIAGVGAHPASHLRRAPRPNELFFRLPGNHLERMLPGARNVR